MTPPDLGGLGVAKIWSAGVWTSELLDQTLMRVPSGSEDRWGMLEWVEDGTSNEGEAYVRLEVLDSTDKLIAGDIKANRLLTRELSDGTVLTWRRGRVDLSELTGVDNNDIKIRIKLFSLTKVPVVRDIKQSMKWKW